jgi:hypothetical protein
MPRYVPEGVTVQLKPNTAQPWKAPREPSQHDHLKKSCADKCEDYQSMIQNYMHSIDPAWPEHISVSSNGFLHACLAACTEGHHLSLSPDDVWLAILSQLSFYVNANEERVREFYVEHKRRKEPEIILKKLWVDKPAHRGNGQLARRWFGDRMIKEVRRIEKPNPYEDFGHLCIEPDFHRTWHDERIAASVIWLGAPPENWSFSCTANHGLPSITLRGIQKDWYDICSRVKWYVGKFGSEATEFARVLEPVLGFFAKTFDEPESPEVKSFWARMVAHEDFGARGTYLSGWITAFCFWDGQGIPPQRRFEMPTVACNLGGVRYHRVNMKELPGGYASLPVKMVDKDDSTFRAKMVAGSTGIKADYQYDGNTSRCSKDRICIQPQPGWWLFAVDGSETEKSEEQESERFGI